MTTSSTDPRIKRWLRLLANPAPTQVESIKIIESDVFEPQVILLDRATAIVGYHGTGKTALSRILEAAFGYIGLGRIPPLITNHNFLQGDGGTLKGVIEVTLCKGENRVSRVIDLSWDGERRLKAWGDQLEDSWDINYVSTVSAFDDLVMLYQEYPGIMKRATEEYPPYNLSRADLDGIRNILGRHYESVTVRPVGVSGSSQADKEYCPLVVAKTSDRTIDIGQMSLGEIWVHYLLNWVMYGNRGTVVVDEPESFLSAQGQRPLIDEVARRALATESQIVVATHSPQVLSRFPLEKIRMCVTTGGKVRVINPVSRTQIRDAVGIETPIRAFVLVEDSFASALLQFLCAEITPWALREVEVITSGSASEVLTGIRAFQASSRFASLALLDGDQRDKLATNKTSKHILFFPGTGEPEREILTALNCRMSAATKLLGRSSEDLIAALTAIAHLDHQYQIQALADRLGLQSSFLTQMLVRLWLRDSTVMRQARGIASAIESATTQR